MPRSDILILVTGPGEIPRRMAHSLRAVLMACNPYLHIDLLASPPSLQNTRSPFVLTDMVERLLSRYEGFCFSRHLTRLLREDRPKAVVCASPTAAALFSRCKEKGKLKTPAAAVVTGDPSLWVQAGLDLYLVAAEPVRDWLIREGLPEDKVVVTDLPVHPRFALTHLPSLLRSRYNLLEDIPSVLLTGELANDKNAISALARFSPGIQLLVYPGTTSTRIPRFVKGLSRNSLNQFQFFTGGETMDELLDATWVLLTSPDDLMAAEAIAKSIPFIIYRPRPQDVYAHHLEETGLALTAATPGELTGKLRSILRNKSERERLRRAERYAAKNFSRPEIAGLLLSLLEPPPLPLRSPQPGSPRR